MTDTRVGVISFPGSNGDRDALHAFEYELGVAVRKVDYRETSLDEFHAVVLPGGFSYGDALRCGAIARFSPIMEALRSFAWAGRPVLGICNGFQVLCEAHLLPGALLPNATLRFHCHWASVRIEQSSTPWTSNLEAGAILRLPVAHGEGAFYASPEQVAEIEANDQVVARYVGPDGETSAESNPNGSVNAIAAVCNPQRNVVGLMPHPERATNDLISGRDGLRMLASLLESVPV